MTSRSILSQLRKNFPTIVSVRMGTGTMKGILHIFGVQWDDREAVKNEISRLGIAHFQLVA